MEFAGPGGDLVADLDSPSLHMHVSPTSESSPSPAAALSSTLPLRQSPARAGLSGGVGGGGGGGGSSSGKANIMKLTPPRGHDRDPDMPRPEVNVMSWLDNSVGDGSQSSMRPTFHDGAPWWLIDWLVTPAPPACACPAVQRGCVSWKWVGNRWRTPVLVVRQMT